MQPHNTTHTHTHTQLYAIHITYLVSAVHHALVKILHTPLNVGRTAGTAAPLLTTFHDHGGQLGAVLEAEVQNALGRLAVTACAARLL